MSFRRGCTSSHPSTVMIGMFSVTARLYADILNMSKFSVFTPFASSLSRRSSIYLFQPRRMNKTLRLFPEIV